MAPSVALQLIDAQATDKGLWHTVESRLKGSEATLAAARTRYLEQRCVLDTAEGVAEEAEALLASLGLGTSSQPAAGTPANTSSVGTGGADAAATAAAAGGASSANAGPSASGSSAAAADVRAHGALRDAGLTCGAATYQSLSRHLVAARAAQRLLLPEGGAPGSARKAQAAGVFSRPGQPQDTDVQRDGSARHLLGVDPDTLRAAHCLPRAAAQRAHAGAAREVEARLVALADAVVAVVLGEEAAGDPSAAAQAAHAVRDASAAVDAAESEAARLLRRAVRLAGGYLEALSGVHSVLLELVEGCMVGRQGQMDEEHCRWLVSHAKTLHSKLHVLQSQLHVATYTSEAVPALRAIAEAVGAGEAAARAAIERVSAQLLAYRECGPEFADVVWQYGQVKEELRKVEHALHHFSQLELELTGE